MLCRALAKRPPFPMHRFTETDLESRKALTGTAQSTSCYIHYSLVLQACQHITITGAAVEACLVPPGDRSSVWQSCAVHSLILSFLILRSPHQTARAEGRVPAVGPEKRFIIMWCLLPSNYCMRVTLRPPPPRAALRACWPAAGPRPAFQRPSLSLTPAHQSQPERSSLQPGPARPHHAA